LPSTIFARGLPNRLPLAVKDSLQLLPEGFGFTSGDILQEGYPEDLNLIRTGLVNLPSGMLLIYNN
jgi:hypothetical protein